MPPDEEVHTVPLIAKERDGYRFFDLRIPVEDLHPTDDALRSLNEDADDRFDAGGVDSGSAVADVHIDEHGRVIDVDWFDSPRPLDDATVTTRRSARRPSNEEDPEGTGGMLDRLRSVFR